MNAPVATCAIAAGNTLGESLTWCDRQESLYWTDIAASTLWRHHPATNTTRTWSLPERLACMALCSNDDWLLLGLASQLAFLQMSTNTLHPICTVENGLPTRLNDGVCDREGRFVFGTIHEPPDGSDPQPVGSYYRLDADLTLHRLELDHVAISNATAFSPDGRTMYFCDSPTRTIQRSAYDADGNAGPAETFVDLTGMEGVPDGATVDADGGLWNAQWGLGRVVRYRPDGSEDVVIAMPAPRVTRPAFGGPKLDALYCTSAHKGMSSAARLAYPQAGHVFVARNAHKGLRETRFAGALPAAHSY